MAGQKDQPEGTPWRMNRTWVIVATVINVLLPGIGTLMLGKWRIGAIQLGVFVAAGLLGTITFGLIYPILLPIKIVDRLWALGSGLWALGPGSKPGSRRQSLI